MSKNQRLAVALALALGSSHAMALGLGSIAVQTKLNEPLVAEIPILGASPAELKALQVRLAPPDAFNRVGLDRPAALSANLEFSVVPGKNGGSVVKVTTPSKVRDPFINFLIEIEWGRGRMLREYTVLLDPPVSAPVRVAPATQAPVATRPAAAVAPAPAPARDLSQPPALATPAAPAATTQPAPASAATPTPAPAPARPAAVPAAPTAAPAAAREDRYGPVREGETLWSIAQFVRPDDTVSMDQVMMALLAENPDAFLGGNINRLKRGAVLRIPTADQIALLTRQAATAQVIEQSREWRAQSGAAAPALQPERSTATPRAGAASSATPASSRLELVPPKGDAPATAAQSGSSQSGGGAELRADLARTKEQVGSLQQENRELQSRVGDLEKIDKESKRLIELKSSALAAAEARVKELETQLAERAIAPVAAPVEPAATPAAEPVAAVSSPTEAEPAAAGEPPAEDALVDVSDVLDEMEGKSPAGDGGSETAAIQEAPVTTPSELSEQPAAEPAQPGQARPWWNDPMVLGGAGVVLFGGLLGVIMAARRKKPAKKPAAPAARSVADDYAAVTAAAAARAEAQGDEAQDLVDAIAEQPDDLGRHLALVRHYYEAGDESGFEGAAEAMYAQLFDPEDLSWKQVVAMGRELLPDHPLFASAADGVEATEAFTMPADHLDDELPPMPVAEAPASFEAHEPALEAFPSAPAEVAEAIEWGAPDENTTQTFNIEDVERLAADQSNAPASPEELALDEDLSLDRELDHEPVAEIDLSGEIADSNDFGALDLGSTDSQEAIDSTLEADDASATKLELARAYLDMGDVEGARGMLEEVVNEGNAGQRSEAKRLLDEIR